MTIVKVMCAAFIATGMMTLFSYLVSYFSSHHFKEPEILNQLAYREPRIPFSANKKSAFGFFTHYLMGCIFVTIFHIIWQITWLKPDLITGSLFGLIAGFIGVSVWKITFVLHKNPIELHLKKYFIQLVIAHIIFGFHVGLVYLYWPVQN